jgi:hypothetical protein
MTNTGTGENAVTGSCEEISFILHVEVLGAELLAAE